MLLLSEILTAPDISPIWIGQVTHAYWQINTTLNRLSHSLLRLNFFLSVLLVLAGSSGKAVGQVAIPLAELDHKLPTDTRRLNSIGVFGGKLYFATTEGLWVIGEDRQALKLEVVRGGAITGVRFGSKTLFVGTSESLWVIDEGGTLTEVKGIKDLNREDSSWEVVGERLFIGTQNEGLWLVNSDGKPTRIEDWKGRISSIVAYGEEAFVISDSGYWLVNQAGHVIRVKGMKGNFYNAAQPVAEKLLVVTDVGVWIVSQDGDVTPVSLAERVDWAWSLGDTVLINTANGSFWLVDHVGRITPVPQLQQWPNDGEHTVSFLGEKLFLGMPDGLYVVDEHGSSLRVEDVKGSIGFVGVGGEQMYVGTTEGLWVFDKDLRQVGRMTSIKGQVMDVALLGADIYVVTFAGLSRLDPKVRIKADLLPGVGWRTLSSNWLPSNWLPSENIQAVGYYADENGHDPYPANAIREFRFARVEGEATPEPQKFTIQGDFNYNIDWGKNEVQFWVLDRWGNVFLTEKAIYFGVPHQIFFAMLFFIVSVLFVLGCFALAPRVDVCHSAIMNPWLRKYFSLGSVPLLLSVFPSLRRHLLRRYSASINRDKEFYEWENGLSAPVKNFSPIILVRG